MSKPNKLGQSVSSALDTTSVLEVPSASFGADAYLQPLAVIRAEHDRQQVVYDQVVKLVHDRWLETLTDAADALLRYFTEDLPLHGADEEEDLFPLLLLRCLRKDGIDELVAQLEFEHTLDRSLSIQVEIGLRSLVRGGKRENPERLLPDLQKFAECQLRHLASENASVLPLAERRLEATDLEALGRTMAARRGITFLR